jgi:hypothetical protein
MLGWFQAPPAIQRPLASFHSHSRTLPAMSCVPNGPMPPALPTDCGALPEKFERRTVAVASDSSVSSSEFAARYQW